MVQRHDEPASEALQRRDSRMFHYLKAGLKGILSLEYQTGKSSPVTGLE
jgi:hypothetical protein